MKASTCPPGIANAAIDGTFEMYEAVTRGTVDYFTGALVRRATPVDIGLDVLAWVRETTRSKSPRWATEQTLLAEWPIARLRDFSSTDSGPVTPTLLLPPQAGHDSCIVDYDRLQSQVLTAKEAGLTRVLSLDWKGASATTKDASIQDYLAVVAASIALLGGRVNLVGDCQGGWLAVIYAALYPDTVETLTIAGAPIDFHAGEPVIHEWMQVLSPGRDLAFYRALVRANGGILPGEFLLGGFIAMQPANELDRRLQLLANINDPDHVNRFRMFDAWFLHSQPIPGAFYLWIVEHLFGNNELIDGTLLVGDRVVDLARITCPLYLLAGETDHITPPDQVFALAAYVGTDPADISRRLAEGGHLGLFMGRKALCNQWLPLFGEIAAR